MDSFIYFRFLRRGLVQPGWIFSNVRGGQHNPAPQGDLLSGAMGPHPLLSLLPLRNRKSAG
jgi:hypothetical protein